MNYEELSAINTELKKTPVSGKPYVMVNDRVQGFRRLFSGGAITTECIKYEPDEYCLFKAVITDENGVILATGWAQETATKNPKFKHSLVENCETSAVGRALGFLGIGSVESIASADEMNKAYNKETEMNETIGESIAADLVIDLMAAGQSPDVVVKYNKVTDLSQLTFEQYNNVVKRYLKK